MGSSATHKKPTSLNAREQSPLKGNVTLSYRDPGERNASNYIDSSPLKQRTKTAAQNVVRGGGGSTELGKNGHLRLKFSGIDDDVTDVL